MAKVSVTSSAPVAKVDPAKVRKGDLKVDRMIGRMARSNMYSFDKRMAHIEKTGVRFVVVEG